MTKLLTRFLAKVRNPNAPELGDLRIISRMNRNAVVVYDVEEYGLLFDGMGTYGSWLCLSEAGTPDEARSVLRNRIQQRDYVPVIMEYSKSEARHD